MYYTLINLGNGPFGHFPIGLIGHVFNFFVFPLHTSQLDPEIFGRVTIGQDIFGHGLFRTVARISIPMYVPYILDAVRLATNPQNPHDPW